MFMKITIVNRVKMFVSSDIPENRGTGSKIYLENNGELDWYLKEPTVDLRNLDISVKKLSNSSYGITISGRRENVSHGDTVTCLPIISGFKLDSNFIPGETVGSIYSTTSNNQLIEKINRKEKLALYNAGIQSGGGAINNQ